ncbi:deoxyribose-phosphate aldolase [Microgenomates group bacterium RBG_16_45_19]|nr:MAG: deoxyribose-phosphate aldolase [Microgenomates group bacterium RBG_16_45_19]
MPTLNSKTITYEQIAKVIDHSLLRPELTEADVIAGCELAARYHAATVCVKPCHVKLAKEVLKDSDVRVGTVVGFPHGSNLTAIKVAEAQQAMDDGAVELDMVLNIGQLRSGKTDYVLADITAVCHTAHVRNVKVKVIFENAYLTNEEKITACKLCEIAGVDWVKTSTGFAPSGATLDDLRLMRAHVSEKVQVKAAGGVRTLPALLDVIDCGATRCGATATAAILDDFIAQRANKADQPKPIAAPGTN